MVSGFMPGDPQPICRGFCALPSCKLRVYGRKLLKVFRIVLAQQGYLVKSAHLFSEAHNYRPFYL